MRILIVDNDMNTVETFKAALQAKTDYKIEVAFSGKDGLAMMKKEAYDLLILDIMMPEMSGLDVCKEMMKDDKLKTIRVLLASALPVASQSFKDSLDNFDELKVVKGVIEKPFLIDDLISEIKKITKK